MTETDCASIGSAFSVMRPAVAVDGHQRDPVRRAAARPERHVHLQSLLGILLVMMLIEPFARGPEWIMLNIFTAPLPKRRSRAQREFAAEQQRALDMEAIANEPKQDLSRVASTERRDAELTMDAARSSIADSVIVDGTAAGAGALPAADADGDCDESSAELEVFVRNSHRARRTSRTHVPYAREPALSGRRKIHPRSSVKGKVAGRRARAHRRRPADARSRQRGQGDGRAARPRVSRPCARCTLRGMRRRRGALC